MTYRDPMEAARARIASLEAQLQRIVEQDLPNRDDALRQALEREADAMKARYEAEAKCAESMARSSAQIAELRGELETIRAKADQRATQRKDLRREVRGRDERIEELMRELEALRTFSPDHAAGYYGARVAEVKDELETMDQRLGRLNDRLSSARLDLASASSAPSSSPEDAARLATAEAQCETCEELVRIQHERRARVAATLSSYEDLLSRAVSGP